MGVEGGGGCGREGRMVLLRKISHTYGEAARRHVIKDIYIFLKDHTRPAAPGVFVVVVARWTFRNGAALPPPPHHGRLLPPRAPAPSRVPHLRSAAISACRLPTHQHTPCPPPC